MLVFITSVKHPENSNSYEKVWQLLNNTLFSVCSQQDQDFRVIVVCDKKLPLSHHANFINKYTEFVEVDFPSHSSDVINEFTKLGNLSPPIDNPIWWNNAGNKTANNDDLPQKRIPVYGKLKQRMEKEFRNFSFRSFFCRGSEYLRRQLKFGKKKRNLPLSQEEYYYFANVLLNKGSKLIIGILSAKKYSPEYISIFDADDFVGNDISAYVNCHSGENGWIMAHGYKLLGNMIVPFYSENSFCGTGNIYSFELLMKDIPSTVAEKSPQNELFRQVDSEFLMYIIGKHSKSRSYYEDKGYPLKEYPTRSVAQLYGHNESVGLKRRNIRQEPDHIRLLLAQKFEKFKPIYPTLIKYFNILAKKTPKVFCLGFHKTGTTSMEALLQDMDYQVARHYKSKDKDFRDALERNVLTELRQLTELYDAFQDTPWFLYFKEFDKWFPGSKFILMTRDSESWWKSYLNYFKSVDTPVHDFIYGYSTPIGHKKEFIERYERHTKEVLDYFYHRPNDLLVIDISEKDAVRKISVFLDRPTKYKKMPHKNITRNKRRLINKKNFHYLINRSRKIKPLSVIRSSKFKGMSLIISGCKHSGTRLLLSILSCHPNIHALSRDLKLTYPKLHPLFPRQSQKPNRSTYNMLGAIDLRQLHHLLSIEKIKRSSNRWAAECSLGVLAYDRILGYYGDNVRILNIVRDGRDVVTEVDEKVPEKYSIQTNRWVYDVSSGIEWEDHPQVMTIRYEDLAQNFELTIRKICKFIDESDVSPLLNYPRGITIIEDQYWMGKWKQPQFTDRVNDLLALPGAQDILRHYGYID